MSSPSHYIPLGCLVITQEQTTLDDEKWSRLRDRYGRWSDISPVRTAENTYLTAVFDEVDGALLKTPPLRDCRQLVESVWIRLQLLIIQTERGVGILRVYGLPDDFGRRLIDRARSGLRRSRRLMFASLDLSPDLWSGRLFPTPLYVKTGLVQDCDAEDAEEESLSLLEMFNTMPSPDPTPEVITNPADQYAANDILASEIPGLRTVLYDYQRRSAAVMVQRESEPGRFLDPRLLKGIDQTGAVYYYDNSSGVFLKESRYYDGVKGGILAEQMGAGKTLICLSVILATRQTSTTTPEIYRGSDVPVRKRIGSLADMAAASATRKAAPWKAYFDVHGSWDDFDFTRCLEAIKRNPGFYRVHNAPARRPIRLRSYAPQLERPARKIWLSHASLVVVPNNLIQQWIQEIAKHTVGPEDPASLKVLELDKRKGDLPSALELATYDIVLISKSRLLHIYKELSSQTSQDSPLINVHFKRCIVDEGHTLGHAKLSSKSNFLLALDLISVSSRWIVTGTPTPGLYGVDGEKRSDRPADSKEDGGKADPTGETEKEDLENIGAIASLYLKARPWANTSQEIEDIPASWAVYVMQPKHTSKSGGRKGVLRATLNSFLIRHQLSELNTLLPAVNENIVVLEGSYQDKLSLNIFSMMIIFNAVQSQRRDMDYFFHARQRKALLQLLHNLKQASFFGGCFFSPEDIKKSLETAEQFLEQKKVPIDKADEGLLKQAMGIARIALEDPLKESSNFYNEIPTFVQDFFHDDAAGAAWSLDDKNTNPICTSAVMLTAVQRLVRSSLGNETEFNTLLNGRLAEEGRKKMAMAREENNKRVQPSSKPQVLAGNTRLGDDRTPRHHRTAALQQSYDPPSERELPEVLKKAHLVSTVSAKLTYLIDAVVEHQAQEKIIIFYENENVAWYMASILDVIHVSHLIYAKSLALHRKMQYINTFNRDPKFRVILMDLSQAAVGLDIRSASRIYFINPVLNPQIQAQAIGRARRISQKKPVTVETLVLRGSIEEVIVERKKSMTNIEHWKCKSILDDRPIYNWILNAGIIPLPEGQKNCLSQAVPLKHPQPVFGDGFGRVGHPDQDLILGDESPAKKRRRIR